MNTEFEWVDIDPKTAEDMLRYNKMNRQPNQRFIRAYATDMRNLDWRTTGDAVKFAKDGTLLDGQHRLLAIIESGVTVRMPVLRGIEPDAQQAMDTGIPRKFADVLTLRGEGEAQALAAIVRSVWAWQNGNWRSNKFQATNPQLLNTLDRHPELRDLTRPAMRCGLAAGIAPSVIGLCMWLFGQVPGEDPDGLSDDIQMFFGRLADGQLLAATDPIYELRKEAKRLRESKRARSDRVMMSALVIKAWNYYRSGIQIQSLKWRLAGSKPERFPEPI